MRTITFATLLASLAAPAFPLEFGNGLSLTGNVELENFTRTGPDGTYGWADLNLGWRSQGGGGLGFGFDLGVDTAQRLSGSGSDDLTAWSGGAVLITQYGEFTIGAPRPVMDKLIDIPDPGNSSALGLELSLFGGGQATLLSKISQTQLYGLSMTGQSGDATYGLSYHRPEGTNVNIFQLAGNYRFGNTLLQGGAERISGSGGTVSNFTIGAEQSFNQFSLGAAYRMNDGVFFGPTNTRRIDVYADYKVMDVFTVAGEVSKLEAGGSEATYYGVSGEYGFGTGGYARLGYSDSQAPGTNAFLDAAVGFRF